MAQDIHERVNNDFSFHPSTPETAGLFEFNRAVLQSAAHDLIAGGIPEGRERSLMLTHLEEAMFWANAAVARTLPVA